MLKLFLSSIIYFGSGIIERDTVLQLRVLCGAIVWNWTIYASFCVHEFVNLQQLIRWIYILNTLGS